MILYKFKLLDSKKFLSIKKILIYFFKDDDFGEIVIDRVCDHFSLTDYKEYFGLKFTLVDNKGDYEIYWLDPLKKVGKQLKSKFI